MPGSRQPKTARQKVKDHWERLRKKGLRPVQFWLPDTRTPEFAAEARRQSLAVANSPQEQEDLDFIEAVAEIDHE